MFNVACGAAARVYPACTVLGGSGVCAAYGTHVEPDIHIGIYVQSSSVGLIQLAIVPMSLRPTCAACSMHLSQYDVLHVACRAGLVCTVHGSWGKIWHACRAGPGCTLHIALALGLP